jgi:hypothetical protein
LRLEAADGGVVRAGRALQKFVDGVEAGAGVAQDAEDHTVLHVHTHHVVAKVHVHARTGLGRLSKRTCTHTRELMHAHTRKLEVRYKKSGDARAGGKKR